MKKYRYTLFVDGMMCGGCETYMNDFIRKNFDVKKVKSSARKNRTIIISTNQLDEIELRKQIDKTGYIVSNIIKEEI